jgi:hypothetical protein
MVLKWVLKCLIFGFMVMCIYEHFDNLFLALDFVLSGGLIREVLNYISLKSQAQVVDKRLVLLFAALFVS